MSEAVIRSSNSSTYVAVRRLEPPFQVAALCEPALVRDENHARADDYTRAVTNPAKALAMTVVDLLADDAREAKRVTAEFKPRMTRDAYLAYLRRLSTKSLYRAEDLEINR